MSISSIGSVTPPTTPEAAAPNGPEIRNDHDADDAPAPALKATPPKG